MQDSVRDLPVDLLFSGALSLGGFVLVFLGLVLTAYGSFHAEQQSAVRSRYRRHAWLSFICFALSLAAGGLGMLARLLDAKHLFVVGIVVLGFAAVLMLVLALLAMSEFKET